MIIEKIAAKKSLAVTLALALFASAPMSAWPQTQAAASRASGGGALLGGAGAVGADLPDMSAVAVSVALPNFSLSVPTLGNAARFSALQAPPAKPVAVSPLSVEAHPVIGLLNALQARGVVLPETLSTRQDAAQLLAAAAALPEGSAKRSMITMANAISAANGAGTFGPEIGRPFDGSGAAKPLADLVTGGWRGFLARLLPSSAVRVVAEQPVNPGDLEVKASDMRFVPAPSRLPESTAEITAADSQIVGQDNALKAIKFGLFHKDGGMLWAQRAVSSIMTPSSIR